MNHVTGETSDIRCSVGTLMIMLRFEKQPATFNSHPTAFRSLVSLQNKEMGPDGEVTGQNSEFVHTVFPFMRYRATRN